jgi:hypothetical protein
MSIFICKFCQSERQSKKSLIGHETFCKNNPNHKIQNTVNGREKSQVRSECVWCGEKHTTGNIKKHEKSCLANPSVVEAKTKVCPVCQTSFTSDSITCSHSCSNTYFRHSREGGIRYKTIEHLIENDRYRDICFRYHEKKCVVCGEENIVAVHHMNENHSDNRPENLVPLCPTHHQYWHSNYKHLVEEQITQYVMEKTKSLSVGKSG